MSQNLSLSEKYGMKGFVTIWELHKDNVYPIFNLGFQPRMFGKIGYEKKNLIVDVGIFAIFDYLLGGTNGDFLYVGVGTGTNAPDAADTDLQTALLWKDGTDGRYRIVKDIFIGATFAAGEAVAQWKEAGCRNRANILISRAAIDYQKLNTYVVTVEWKYSYQ